MEYISYKKGYKYQLVETYIAKIDILPETPVDTDYLGLTAEGELAIKKGYAWDGPSGPTVDTLNFMRGSLVHDALYQLMRERHLDKDTHRDPADRLLQQMCRQDGMSAFRAWIVYQGLRLGGGPAADPSSSKPITKAPKPGE